MAIKAIINNTEKEIEQIKNSDEQDIDYVYSRIGDTEVEGESPISIKSIGGELADYRIYGNTANGESVGDLETTGEHAGEYKVPVTVEGKNLAKNNYAKSSTLFTVEEVNNFIHVSGTNNSGSTKAYVISKENVFPAGSYDIVNNSDTTIGYDYKDNNDALVYGTVSANSIKTFNFPAVVTRYLNIYKSVPNGESIDNHFQTMVVRHGTDASTYEPYHTPITTSIYLPEEIKKVGEEAEYIDYGEQKLHRIGAEDIGVTLPALSTIKGTNTLSVNTSIQPSNMYIKDNFDYKKVFTATRAIEDELPLNYRSIEDNDSTLKNYRIYGQTVDGESVGDRTGNLFDYVTMSGTNGKRLMSDGSEISDVQWAITDYIPCDGLEFTINKIGGASPAICLYDGSKTFIAGKAYNTQSAQTKVSVTISSNTPAKYIRFSYFKSNSYPTAIDNLTEIMLNSGSTALPYEPYGYRVPVTVSNGIDTLTTPIYLPEQIRKVGDEAEYIDFGEQKQHRVRKNLLQNTATSQTIAGVTFTVNEDGSVTCNGTAGKQARLSISSDWQQNVDIGSRYTATGCPPGGSEGSYYLDLYNFGWEFGNGISSIARYVEGSIYRCAIIIAPGYTCNNLTFYPMIRKANIEDDTYEPYITNTELDVTLPALPVLTGTNTLSVWTEAQPSDIYLKGKIKKKPKIYYKIYYYSQDGQTALSTETVEEGHDCTYSIVPTKESDTGFDYTFTGWSTSPDSTTATAGATENIQQNTNLYAAFIKSFKPDTISDSWEEIIANCDNGTYASKYQIGDLKTIDVGTEGPVQMQIVAIDTDLLASDNTKKAPITWISKQLLNTYKAMHSTSSNYLSDWTNCDMRTYLKNTILPMLPSIVQNNIKEVTKYTNQRTGSTTFTTISSTEDIWLPSYREVSYYTTNCETSGVQYNSIFTNDDASQRIKSNVGNDTSYWWTRSASGNSLSNYQYYFAFVGWLGYTDYTGWDCTSFGGVAIGFCT